MESRNLIGQASADESSLGFLFLLLWVRLAGAYRTCRDGSILFEAITITAKLVDERRWVEKQLNWSKLHAAELE